MGTHKEEKIVVIDTDAGIDDALAIYVAIAAHRNPDMNFRIVGITCVNGNTSLDNVCVNVTRTLASVNAADQIPIYKGCATPMVVPYKLGKHKPLHHGKDGFGDAGLPRIEAKLEDENAVLALIRLSKEFKGRLSILALGPLTNIAMAAKLDESFNGNIKEVYLMGGNCEGVGNITLCGEFNFVVDPEAAFVTLSSFTCPIVIVPWEVCKSAGHHFFEFRTKVLGPIESPAMNVLNAIEKQSLERPIQRWLCCDTWAAAVLIDARIGKSWTDIHATVELSGKHARGLMVIDHEHYLGQLKNKRIIKTVDMELCKKLILWAVGGEVDYNLSK